MSKSQRDRQWQIKLPTVVACALMSTSAANQTDTIMEHYRPPCECKNWTDSEEDWWWFSPTMMAAAKNHCALPASDPTRIPSPKLTFSRSSSRLFHTCLHSQPSPFTLPYICPASGSRTIPQLSAKLPAVVCLSEQDARAMRPATLHSGADQPATGLTVDGGGVFRHL